MSIENEMIKIAVSVFNVKETEVTVDSRFKGGMSNYTYLVHVKGNPYVIRVIGEGGEPLVNPVVEKKHLDLIKDLNISSEVVYFDEKTGIKVSHYVDGEPLSVAFTDADYAEVAATLKKLHQSKIAGADYDLKGRLRKYEKLLKAPPSHTYHMLKMYWLKLYDELYQHETKVFCHGDAQRSNFVKGKDKIYLLDWEFAGLNDPYYDMASFGTIGSDEAEKLLTVYLGKKPTDKSIRRLNFYKMFQMLQWHVVATYKHEAGMSETLKMDFSKIATMFLNFAAELFEKIKG